MDSGFTWAVCVLGVFIVIRFTDLPIFAVYVIAQSLDFLKVLFGLYLINKGVWITNLVRKEEA